MKTFTIRTKAISISVVALSILIFGCKKDDEMVSAPAPQPVTYSSLAEYMDLQTPQSQSFEIDASVESVLNASNGSVITVPANSLIHSDGSLVSGMVNFKVKEVFSESDMMFSGVFPISYGHALNSGGEFFLEASQNGEILRVADGSFVEIDIPAQADPDGMQLFFAGPIEEPDTANWEIVDTTFTNSGFVFNSVDNSYQIDVDTLGWGNIDAFDWSVTYFDCYFNLVGVEGLDGTNTTAFAVFENQNTVWPVGSDNWYGTIENNQIFESHLADVPLNLVVISVVDGQLYSGLLSTTPEQGVTYDIDIAATTSEDLDALIEGLP